MNIGGFFETVPDYLFTDEQLEAARRGYAFFESLVRVGIDAPRTEPLLMDADEVARLLGITREALDKRVQRHQVPGVVRTGRRVQFNRERLLAGINKRTNR